MDDGVWLVPAFCAIAILAICKAVYEVIKYRQAEKDLHADAERRAAKGKEKR